jgi:hypothetical protein
MTRIRLDDLPENENLGADALDHVRGGVASLWQSRLWEANVGTTSLWQSSLWQSSLWQSSQGVQGVWEARAWVQSPVQGLWVGRAGQLWT